MIRFLILSLLISALAASTAEAQADRKRSSPLEPGVLRRGQVARRAMAIGRWDGPVEVIAKMSGSKVSGEVMVYLPAGYDEAAPTRAPLVVVLPDRGDDPATVRDRADLEILADRYGLVLAVPALGSSIYETALYPETKKPWAPIPGTRWIGEAVVPYVRKHYAVATDRARSAVVGYGFGGRGALLLASKYPMFTFAASLSAPLDLTALQPRDDDYKAVAMVLGSRRKLEDRWRAESCVAPTRVATLGGTALYLGHGERDSVVPPVHLTSFLAALDAAEATGARRPAVTVVRSPDGGHDWAYWNSQWPALFEALARAVERSPDALPAGPAAGVSAR